MIAAPPQKAPPGHKVRVLTAKGLRELFPDALPVSLHELDDSQCPVTWIHAEHDDAVVTALEGMGLDEIAVKSLREGPERPRVEEFSDHLYISLFSAGKPVGGRGPDLAEHVGTGAALPRLRQLRPFLGSRWLISVGHIAASDNEALQERMRRQVFSRDRGPSFIVMWPYTRRKT